MFYCNKQSINKRAGPRSSLLQDLAGTVHSVAKTLSAALVPRQLLFPSY